MSETKELIIEDAEAYDLAVQLSGLTGEDLPSVLKTALRERLKRESEAADRRRRIDAIIEIGRRYAALPDKDTRTPEEILGYDENGLPT